MQNFFKSLAKDQLDISAAQQNAILFDTAAYLAACMLVACFEVSEWCHYFCWLSDLSSFLISLMYEEHDQSQIA